MQYSFLRTLFLIAICATILPTGASAILTEAPTTEEYSKIINFTTPSSSGFRAEAAGDINNDGIDDMLIRRSRSMRIVYGSNAELSHPFDINSTDATITSTNNRYIYEVSSLGDVNNDGIDDFALASYDDNSDSNFAGEVYVFFGSTTPYSGELTTDDADAIILGENAGDYFGYSVKGIGDIDGDGIDDMAIGAQRYDVIEREGAVYVLYGGSNLFQSNRQNQSGEYPVTNIASAKITGDGTTDRLGFEIEGIGNFNGDGIDDLLLTSGETARGYIINGSSTRLSGTATITNTTDSTFKIGTFPEAAAGLGDLDGDGFDDLAIEYNYDETEGVKIVYGRSNTFANTYTVASGEALFRTDGYAGILDLDSAGDVNGDGYPDFIAGDPYGPGQSSRYDVPGTAFIIHGTSSRYFGLRDINGSHAPDTIIEIVGEANGDEFAEYVAGVGDINNDGLDDLFMSADSNVVSSEQTGAGYIRYGGDITREVEISPTPPLLIIQPEGNISAVARSGGTLNLSFQNGAQTQIIPFGGSEKFRYSLSSDESRLVVTNGKKVKVYADGSLVDSIQVNKKKPKKKKHIQLKVRQVYNAYDSIVVATARKQKGKVTVMRLTDSNTLTKKRKDTVAISKKTVKLRVKNGKKKIRVKWGKKTHFWKIKKKGKLVHV